jgi:acylphosphatase
MAREGREARRYFVRGHVQGVGFRWFAERAASELGLTGYARNLEDGRVEVYAVGPPGKLKELEARLWRGPRMAEVRGVESQEAAVENLATFRIEV